VKFSVEYTDNFIHKTWRNLCQLPNIIVGSCRPSEYWELHPSMVSVCCVAAKVKLWEQPKTVTYLWDSREKLHGNTLIVMVSVLGKSKLTRQQWMWSSAYACHSQSIRPSPAAWITATSCWNYILTSSAPDGGRRLVHNNQPKT
jgi:hypothetical protein